MAIVAKKPAAELFGFEVGSDINKNKSLLKQCTEALTTQSPTIPVVLPAAFNGPGNVFGSTPIAVEIEWIKNIQAAMDGAAIDRNEPVFAEGENDNQSVFVAKHAKQMFDDLRVAGYIA